ncbi:MAG: ABC transporter ATP-binding protein [Bacillota bacterium]|jgi:oligopeptide/dipeptide ABC transporter ATP-binding protein|nr:ABC transporter ATP-binding protein [Bacillota bacterium]HHT91732.1 ABC transporter ATP-binding protein [Bacillota bacterium]
MEPILKLRNLKVVFPTNFGLIRAVESVDLDIGDRECVALVGESGCGKSVTSQSVMRLIESPPAVTRVDAIEFAGRDIKDYGPKQMQEIRGKEMSMIFQDAMTSLNPVMTVGNQIDEMYRRHQGDSKKAARQKTVRALELIGLPEPTARANSFPHELSGGMRQRVLLAMAFACMPKLIIADEPTTALDVTIQAQVLKTLRGMQRGCGTSLLLVTHDLSVVASIADTVYVMYSGKIVEKAPVKDLFTAPQHPYTVGLMAAVPRLTDEKRKFTQIPGAVPHPARKPSGCYFHPRCDYATAECKKEMPPLVKSGADREVRCFHPLTAGGRQ